MRIAVSGASGFIGSALCRTLTCLDHEIIRLVRPGATVRNSAVRNSAFRRSPTATNTDRDQTVQWHPQTGLTRPNAFSCDAVIHLAGRSIGGRRWTAREKVQIRESRVQATRVLADQLSKMDSPPQVFVSASATGVYGDCGERIVDESASLGTGFLAEVAADWEGACSPLTAAGVRVVHPRLGIVLAQQGGALNKMLPIFRYRLGGRLGAGTQYWSWIALSDCIAAIIWLLNNQTARGAYNIVAPNPVTNRQFTSLLARQLAVPAFLQVPAFALRLAMGEMADALLLGSCRAAPSRLLDGGFQFQHPELSEFLAVEFTSG